MTLTAEDRRKHPRYKIENSVSVSTDGIYQITDISNGGFCFRCSPYTAVSDFWETDIITPIEQLKGFPVKRAWISMTKNHSHEMLPMVVGARFGKLSRKQDALLSQLIEVVSQNQHTEQ